MMQLEQAKDVDLKRWDSMVEMSGATIFSTTTYISSTAENWAVAWNEDKSGGILCPYTLRMGVKVLYPPFFHRYCEWVGENPPQLTTLIAFLKECFQVAHFQLGWKKIGVFENGVYQFIEPGKKKLNQQAKRALKQVGNFLVVEGDNSNELIGLIQYELAGKIHGIEESSIRILERLTDALKEKYLLQLNLTQEGVWLGGIWLIKFNNRLLYLKGTVTSEAKKQGGMYHLMNHAIDLAEKEGLLFDFGGSNAQGVQRFNLNWGSENQVYHLITWNHAPIWWKVVRNINKRIRF